MVVVVLLVVLEPVAADRRAEDDAEASDPDDLLTLERQLDCLDFRRVQRPTVAQIFRTEIRKK